MEYILELRKLVGHRPLIVPLLEKYTRGILLP
jgi:hypothetical protein